MKKKRLIDSNNNNKKSAPLFNIAKKSIEKKTNGNNNNNSIPNDKHHNRSTPCSNSVADIVREIFPGTTTKDDDIKILSSDQSDDQFSAVKSSTTTAKLHEGDHKKQEEKEEEVEEPQPLLGYMIQSYLIEERKRVREQQQQQQGSINNNINSTSSTSKKKKNKKKKKKKQTANSSAVNATATTTSSTVDGIECELENSKNKEEQQGSSSSGRKVALSTLLSATSKDGIECELERNNNKKEGGGKVPTVATAPTEGESFDDNDTTSDVVAVTAIRDSPNSVIPTLLPIQSSEGEGSGGTSFISPLYGEEHHYDCNNKVQEKEKQSPPPSSTTEKSEQLDRLLDSLIDSSTSISSSSKKEKVSNNRNIEAFSTFLSRKLMSHLQEKDKSKGSSSSRSGIEYKDILPSISINDATDLCNSVDCRKCRSSALKRLRTISSDETVKSHKTDEGWEMELVPTKMMNKVSVNNNNTKDSTHMIVTLNDESVKIPPLPSSSSDSSGVKKTTKSNNGLLIPVSGPLGDMLSEDLVENAFNYMSMDDMEAGYGQQDYDIEGGGGGGGGRFGDEVCNDDDTKKKEKSSSFNLEFHPISRANESVRYLQVGLVPKMDGGDSNVGEEGSILEFPMKADDIIGLVKNILLPCGLGQVKGSGDNNVTTESTADHNELGNEEMNQIANKAYEEVQSIQGSIVSIRMKMYEINRELEEVDHDKKFDSRSSKILRGCDDNCEWVMKQVGDILVLLFKVTCYVGWASTRGAKLMAFMHNLWNRYNAAFVELIEPVLQYRGKLVQAGIRGGTVPQAFFNAVVRNGLEELIKTKIIVLNSLVEELVKSITNGPSGEPSPVVVLNVLKAYREQVEQPKVSLESNIFPDQASEELMRQFIAARINMSFKTVQGSQTKVEAIERKAREQREEMSSLIKTIRRIVMAMEDFAPETKLDFLNKGYSSNEDAYYELEKKLQQDDCTGSVGDALLLKKSFHLIMQWLILLCSKQCNESSMESLTLPSRLDKWLDGTTGTAMPKSMPGDDIKKNKKEECPGDAGQRRVSSILAALLYRWLEERCSEWHAELTRDELLQSMDMEDPVVAREGGKSGKKKKSKRKGKNKGGNEPNVTTQEVSTGTNDKKPVDEKRASSSTEDKTVHNVEEKEKKDESVQLGTDEMKEDVVEVDANESLTVEDASSLKLDESLAATEDSKNTIPVSSEGEWKLEQKSKRKGPSKENGSHVQNTSKETPSNKKQIANERKKVSPPSKGSGNKPEIGKELVVNTKLNEKQAVAPAAKDIKSGFSVKPVSSVNKKPLTTELKETPAKKKKEDSSDNKSCDTSKKSEDSINKETLNSEQQEKVPSLKDWLSANSTVNKKTMSSKRKETAAVEKENSNSKKTNECSAKPSTSKSKKPVISEQQAKAPPVKESSSDKKSVINTKSVPVASKKPISSESGKPAPSMNKTSSNSEQEEDVNKKPDANVDKAPVVSEQKVKRSEESSSDERPVANKKHQEAESATKKCPHCAKAEIDMQPEISSKPELTDKEPVVSERQEGVASAMNEPNPNGNKSEISQHQDKPAAEVVKKVGSKVKVNATSVDEIEVVKGISNDDEEEEEDFFFGVDDSKNDAVETVIAKKEEPQQTSTQQTASAGRVPPPNFAVNANAVPQQPAQYSYPPPSHYYYPPLAHAQQYSYPPPPQQYGYPAHPHQYMYPPPPQQYCYPPPPHHMQQPPMDNNHHQESYKTNCEYYPTVSVVDGQQQVVAEMYLVKRLDVGTGSKRADSTSSTDKKKSSTDKNKVPVVWL